LRAIGHWPSFRGQQRIVQMLVPWRRPSEHYSKSIALRDDLKIHIATRSWIERHIFIFGCYEPEIVSHVQRPGRHDALFVDIGAIIGVFSFVALQHFLQVHAFEPQPVVCQRLRENVELYNIANIEVHQGVVSSNEEEAFLHFTQDVNETQGRASGVPVTVQRDDVALESCSQGRARAGDGREASRPCVRPQPHWHAPGSPRPRRDIIDHV